MPNKDLCHIIVADGMFDHHMPDILQEVIEHLYRQQVERMNLSVATLDDPIELDPTYDDKKENGQFFHNDEVFPALSDMKKICLNEDTIKTVDKHGNTTNAIVHAPPAIVTSS